MAKLARKRGPKFGDKDLDERTFKVHREALEAPSSRVIYFDCPFCGVEVKAYVWSICGGGKRCDCGAIFGGMGSAQHFKTREG